MERAQVMDGFTFLSLNPYLSLGLCIFCISYTPSHTRIYTQSDRPMSFLPACVVFITGQCSDKHKGLHCKAGIPRINPAIVFPDPWFRSAAELVHIPLDLWCAWDWWRHVWSGRLTVAGWLADWMVGWMVGWTDACRFLAGWQTASSACLRVYMQMCASVRLSSCPSDYLTVVSIQSRVKSSPERPQTKPREASNLLHIQYLKRKVCWQVSHLSDPHFNLFLDLQHLLLREKWLWS